MERIAVIAITKNGVKMAKELGYLKMELNILENIKMLGQMDKGL